MAAAAAAAWRLLTNAALTLTQWFQSVKWLFLVPMTTNIHITNQAVSLPPPQVLSIISIGADHKTSSAPCREPQNRLRSTPCNVLSLFTRHAEPGGAAETQKQKQRQRSSSKQSADANASRKQRHEQHTTAAAPQLLAVCAAHKHTHLKPASSHSDSRRDHNRRHRCAADAFRADRAHQGHAGPQRHL